MALFRRKLSLLLKQPTSERKEANQSKNRGLRPRSNQRMRRKKRTRFLGLPIRTGGGRVGRRDGGERHRMRRILPPGPPTPADLSSDAMEDGEAGTEGAEIH